MADRLRRPRLIATQFSWQTGFRQTPVNCRCSRGQTRMWRSVIRSSGSTQRLRIGLLTSGGGTDLPPASTFLISLNLWSSNNGSAPAVGFDICSAYIKTDCRCVFWSPRWCSGRHAPSQCCSRSLRRCSGDFSQFVSSRRTLSATGPANSFSLSRSASRSATPAS